MQRRSRRRPVSRGRNVSWRTRKSLAIVFAVVFAPPAAQRARAECLPFTGLQTVAVTDIGSPVGGDVDGDGDTDVLFAKTNGSGLFAWAENNGSGAGWTLHTIATPTGTRRIAGGDLDRDGDLDAVTAAVTFNEIAWQENLSGDGSSWSSHTISTSSDFPDLLALADLDRDGDLDPLVGSFTDETIAWYENDGAASGAWTKHEVATALGAGDFLLAADIDRDSDLDVLLATGGSDLRWLANDGAGGGWGETLVVGGRSNLSGVAVADLDGDGDLDAAVTARSGADLVWYGNDGAGGGWTAQTVTETLVPGATGVAATDADGDGDLDLLVTGNDTDLWIWFENDGSGTAWAPHTLSTAIDRPQHPLALDIDGDGDADALASGNVNAGPIGWLANLQLRGEPLFLAPATVSTAFAGLKDARPADVDGDGDLDVVAASYSNDLVAWAENEAGDGSAWSLHTISALADDVRSAVPADLDGDGDLDVATALETLGVVAWLENLSGDGSSWTAHPIATGVGGAYAVHAVDLDHDGDLDVLSAASIGDVVAWSENLGDAATWTTHPIWTDGSTPVAVAAGDLDGDGDLDALAAVGGSDLVSWHENTAGDGSAWSMHTVDGAATGAQGVGAADVDGDGDLDVLSAASDLDRIAWHENTAGDGSTWLLHTVTTGAATAWRVEAADVDRDGDLDLLSASIGDDRVAWYENVVGDGSAWSMHDLSTASTEARRALAADLDGDGDLDVLAAAQFGPELHWFENRGTRVFGHGFETEGDGDTNLGCWSTTVP